MLRKPDVSCCRNFQTRVWSHRKSYWNSLQMMDAPTKKKKLVKKNTCRILNKKTSGCSQHKQNRPSHAPNHIWKERVTGEIMFPVPLISCQTNLSTLNPLRYMKSTLACCMRGLVRKICLHISTLTHVTEDRGCPSQSSLSLSCSHTQTSWVLRNGEMS